MITVLGFRGLFALNQTNLCLNVNPQRNYQASPEFCLLFAQTPKLRLATIKIEDSTVYPASTVALIFPREVAYLGKIETTLLEGYQQF